MALADIIRGATELPLEDEDGGSIELRLLPPLTPAEIDAFAAELPCPLPDEVRELLLLCRGVEGLAADVVDFTGAGLLYEFEAVFPHGLPVAGDGYGNFWVIDLLPGTTSWGPVYFACHDPPIILRQSDTLATFLSDLIKMELPPHESTVDDVHEDRLFDVWRTNPGVIAHAQCVGSADAALSDFARSLGPTFQFIDLRDAPVGYGFSWGRYGPHTVVRRAGHAPIFAYEKKTSWLRRMLK